MCYNVSWIEVKSTSMLGERRQDWTGEKYLVCVCIYIYKSELSELCVIFKHWAKHGDNGVMVDFYRLNGSQVDKDENETEEKIVRPKREKVTECGDDWPCKGHGRCMVNEEDVYKDIYIYIIYIYDSSDNNNNNLLIIIMIIIKIVIFIIIIVIIVIRRIIITMYIYIYVYIHIYVYIICEVFIFLYVCIYIYICINNIWKKRKNVDFHWFLGVAYSFQQTTGHSSFGSSQAGVLDIHLGWAVRGGCGWYDLRMTQWMTIVMEVPQ